MKARTDTSRHDHVRTACGRDLTVGHLSLGDAAHPAARVFVDLGQGRDSSGSMWAGLTTTEARQLAAAFQRADALLAVASHCTVHNTLRQKPDVSIELHGQ